MCPTARPFAFYAAPPPRLVSAHSSGTNVESVEAYTTETSTAGATGDQPPPPWTWFDADQPTSLPQMFNAMSFADSGNGNWVMDILKLLIRELYYKRNIYQSPFCLDISI